MHAVWQKGAKLAILLLGLLILYPLLLLGAYSFPDEWIEDNVNGAVEILQEESNMLGGYATYFWHSGYGITDNVTDVTMYRGLLRNGRSAMDAAMRTDYARYWHGYAVILRPMSIVFHIIHIRYINMIVLMLLLILCYWHCRQRLGAKVSFCFAMGLVMSFILIAPFCQQYYTVYFLTLAGCLLVLRWWEALKGKLDAVFLVSGSLVCFFDFLTFPLLALGYPLILCLLLLLSEGAPAKRLWVTMIRLSALWMAAYALTWLAKAGIGSLLTNQNVLADVLEQVLYRMKGIIQTDTRTIEVTPWDAIKINLETFFNGSNIGFFLLLLLTLGANAVISSKRRREWVRSLALIAVALYPFAWYCILQNHVRMHFWMTYRMLAITVFAVCAFLLAVAKNGFSAEEGILPNMRGRELLEHGKLPAQSSGDSGDGSGQPQAKD